MFNFILATNMIGFRSCLIFLGLFLAEGLGAVEVAGLFEVEVIAESQAEPHRRQAIAEALRIVLGRVVVGNESWRTPAVSRMLEGGDHYIKQAQFSLVGSDVSGNGSARLLRVLFDQEQVLQMLRGGNVGIWNEERPETLLWLVVDQQGNRQFYNAESMPELEGVLASASKIKGVPLIFPMLDLEEQKLISVSQVLSAHSKYLLDVSQRYDTPAVMAGRLVSKQSCWQADWSFYFDGRIKQWQSNCLPLQDAVLDGMNGAYDILARYYGIKSGSGQ